MQALAYIGVILITAAIVIFGMTAYQGYLNQAALVADYKQQILSMAQVCSIQVVPSRGRNLY